MKQRQRLWHAFKRGMASVFVLAIILGLPVLGARQLLADRQLVKANKAADLPDFKPRAVDSQSPPRLFEEPLISIAFDDGWETTYSVAAPILMRDGIRSTQYLVSGLLDDPAYLSLDQVRALQQRHQQIACHTVSHPDLVTIPADQLEAQLAGCEQYFSKHGFGTIRDFAAPYGSTNPAVLEAIARYFRSERNTNGDISNGVADVDVNLPGNFDPHDIIGITVHSDTTVEQMRSAVAYAVEHKGWLVFTYHQAEEAGSKFSLSQPSLKKQLDYLSGTSIRIVTVGQVIDSLAASN